MWFTEVYITNIFVKLTGFIFSVQMREEYIITFIQHFLNSIVQNQHKDHIKRYITHIGGSRWVAQTFRQEIKKPVKIDHKISAKNRLIPL